MSGVTKRAFSGRRSMVVNKSARHPDDLGHLRGLTRGQQGGGFTRREEELLLAAAGAENLLAGNTIRGQAARQRKPQQPTRTASASRVMVGAVVDSAVRNADALLTLCKLRRHDAYTFTHGVNVSVLATAFGVSLGLSREDLQELGLAGLYHDLGKTGIPDAILNKPGRLTEAEYVRVKQHPALGGKLLAGLGLSEGVLRGVIEHQERFDGSGYPRGLSGAAIHKWGRVLALADVYDALTSRRSYKRALLPTRALAVIHGMMQ